MPYLRRELSGLRDLTGMSESIIREDGTLIKDCPRKDCINQGGRCCQFCNETRLYQPRKISADAQKARRFLNDTEEDN